MGPSAFVKTTLELPDALLRETRAFAARRGLSLRQVIVEALAQKLKVEQESPESKPWLQAFRDIERDQVLKQELLRLRRRIEAEFEQVNPEEWNDIWIASLARQHGLAILSQDAHFDTIPGLQRVSW
jgi:predicted nucleic acid-binding protein